MSVPGWWDVNRLLQFGSSGPDVERLQQTLNDNMAGGRTKLRITKVFDPDTMEAVKAFQKEADLVADGKVGPVTFSILVAGNYRFLTRYPPKILQRLDECWAASMQSALESTWAGLHPYKTRADLLKEYKTVSSRTSHALTLRGWQALVSDLKLHRSKESAKFFRLEPILAELEKNGRQVVMSFPTGDEVSHAVVVFGVHIREGVPNLVVMDPQIGDYKEIDVDGLRRGGGDLLFASHSVLPFFPFF